MNQNVRRLVYDPFSKKIWGDSLSDWFAQIEATGFRVASVTFYENSVTSSVLPRADEMIGMLPRAENEKAIPNPKGMTPHQQAIIDKARAVLKISEGFMKAREAKSSVGEGLGSFWGAEISKSTSEKAYKGYPLRLSLMAEGEGLLIEVYG